MGTGRYTSSVEDRLEALQQRKESQLFCKSIKNIPMIEL